MFLKLAFHSLHHRKITVLLTLLSIAISTMIVLSIEHIREQTRKSFTSTLSSTDLIVGARAGRINLLLYSVFRIGDATNNISWESYQKIKGQRGVAWTIPISLGDSHRGYRVLGTDHQYFDHYRYGNKQAISLQQGERFEGVYDAVLGAEVARKLGYELGEKIVLSHGTAAVSFKSHDDKPFTVVGILAATGTPVDQTIHIPLEGMEAIHIGWENGVPSGVVISAEDAIQQDLTPKNITAFLLGLDNKMLTFRLQRAINNYSNEALMAILPGVALTELWQTMNIAEKALSLVAFLVVLTSLLGMMTIMLSSIQQRKHEVAVLRAIGAPSVFIFCLIQAEILFITIGGILLGTLMLFALLFFAQTLIVDYYGLLISINPISQTSFTYAGIILVVAFVMACIPAFAAYQQSKKETF